MRRFSFSLFWLFLAWCLPLDGFDMRIFKVGQANFVLLTHREKALVVDCGVGGGYGKGILTKISGEYWTEIETALEDVVLLGIVFYFPVMPMVRCLPIIF
ncbi:MAG: hypothetical protein LBJ13_01200 [Puniceicoccales bacterium]|jgi:hypothetical protein|nr:hypothetical protein [Puniceicoccales bacterium]